MKKRFIYLIIGSLIFTGISSCDVNEIPETSMNDGNYWNTVSDLRMAANYFYTTLPGLTSGDVSEDVWSSYGYSNSGSGTGISDGSRATPPTSGDYNYYGIFQANKLIENAPKVLEKGAAEAEVNWYIGEAHFFRATFYYEMFKRFGGVPMITKTLKIGDPEVFSARASRAEILDLILKDLDVAIQYLRSSSELVSAKEYGRISKTAALAFKARVALFEGTREKFHKYGDSKKHLTIARDAAKEVMDSKQHSLFTQAKTGSKGERTDDAYFNLFQLAGEGSANKENIIVRQYGVNRENSVTSTAVQRYYEGSNILPTQNFVDNYLMADGLPITKSKLYVEPNKDMKYIEYFNKKDPRMSFTLFKPGDEFISSSNYTLPNPRQHRSGYGIRKYANKEFWNLQSSFIDKPVLRYAEVLLIYAEATYELNESITDADLDLTINLLRSRLPQINIGTAEQPNFVDMPKLSNQFVNTNTLNMREEIRRERLVELAYEGFAYWDLIRWKTAEIEMKKPLMGSYLFSEFLNNSGEKWSATTPVDSKGNIILQDANLRKFDPEKDYLWPIPTQEIAINNKIEQNPKW
ncbi:RagB/SusD family nutrient uptake outer membrane protein [Sphingobacterium cellulitidis]|uniref:RagB/SusD family nutrient uptake outer membrane protein n=1 Tax=Sphingobacterium cellulitidis TaxID=1768011 RepID=UPI000B9438F5|nr:RagB/SusD family nutrient uptake outer membrane protein [Sphingobacterium cellulitidis]OYD47160.1 RagB/SusD family nutrient uptake outer membrane protein [Sphingobacterium cellulitidis]